jgi:putative phage-type endonuclease
MIEQRTEEWLEIRSGKFTASDIHRLMGVRGMGKTGETYVMEKVAEQLGAHMPMVSSKAMEHGTATEPFAKLHYERAFGVEIEDQSFIIAPWNAQAGCSPDGIIRSLNRGIEIKCPYSPANHIRHLMIKSADDLKDVALEYYWQIQMCMAVTGLPSWDFVSYCDEFHGELRMMAIEIFADVKDIELMKTRIDEAVKMKDEIIKKVLA